MTHRTYEKAEERVRDALTHGDLDEPGMDLIATMIDGLTTRRTQSHTRGGLYLLAQWVRDRLDGRR